MPADFLDTNVLVYAFSDDPRAARAQELLAQGCSISVQGLNEFANVARRKLGMTWAAVRNALDDIRAVCPTIQPVSLSTHGEAIRLAERHNFSLFDALVVAAALEAGSAILWSEDMKDGMRIDAKLRIANPF